MSTAASSATADSQATWPEVLTSLIAGRDLSSDHAAWAMGEILSGNASDAQIAGFMVALRAKGESTEELAGLAQGMLDQARPLRVSGRLLDIVGTGGDRSMSVNISTMSAIVAAAAGAKVLKHGNRSASSKTGTADVLEELGVRLDLSPEQVAHVADEVGISFAFAAAFHPAMRFAASARSELGIATSFNLLGPLANPVRPQAQAIGCADVTRAPLMAGVFAQRGVDAWVFRGDDGLDELTTTTTSTLWIVREGTVQQHTLDPLEWDIPRGTQESLRGDDRVYNAAVVRRLLGGEQGPVRDAVVLNAGAALAVHAAADVSWREALATGIERAREALDSGAGEQLLTRWVEVTRSL